MPEKEAEEATGPELTVQGLSLPQLKSSVVSLVVSLAPMVADLQMTLKVQGTQGLKNKPQLGSCGTTLELSPCYSGG